MNPQISEEELNIIVRINNENSSVNAISEEIRLKCSSIAVMIKTKLPRMIIIGKLFRFAIW